MDDVGLASGLILFAILGAIGIGMLRSGQESKDGDFAVRLFCTAFAIRFGVSIIIYVFGLVDVIKDEDGSGWLVGKFWAQDWATAGVTFFDLPGKFAESYSLHHKGYYFLLAILYFVTSEPTRMAAAVLNCFLGAWTAVICYRTAKALFADEIAERVGWWVCLYPSLIMWSAQTLKEPVVIFLESLVIYGCVSMRQPGKLLGSLLMIGCSIALIIPFRFYAAYVAAAVFVLSFLLSSGNSKRGSNNSLAFFILSSVAFLVLAFFLLGRENESKMLKDFDLEGIEKYRNAMAKAKGEGAGSNVEIDSDLTSGAGFAVSLATGAVHVLFAPFPWQLLSGSTRMLLAAPDVLLWWWLLLAGVLPGMALLVRTRFRDVAPLLIMAFGLGLVYSLTFANVGLVYRQRAQLLPWLIVFGVVGLERKKLHLFEDPPDLVDSEG
jgi:hypothetical protein